MTHINGNVRFLKIAAIAGAVAAGMAFGQTAFTDKRDNQSYNSVKIGNQTWMARNLNYNINGSKCYDHNPSNCDKYGKLYNWDAAINACPGGWHLPKDYEWEMLANYIGGDAGKKLKSRSGWAQNGNGTDDYGFSALPGGTGKSDGSFILMGEFGYWWSIGEGADVYYRYISFKDDDLSRYISTKKGSFPVRCVKDNGGTIETAGGSNSSGAVAPKRGQNMFGYVICIAVVVVVFVAIIGISRRNKRMKSKWISVLLCLFFGWFGAHRFYEGKIVTGVLWMCTFGIFGLGWIFDLWELLIRPNHPITESFQYDTYLQVVEALQKNGYTVDEQTVEWCKIEAYVSDGGVLFVVADPGPGTLSAIIGAFSRGYEKTRFDTTAFASMAKRAAMTRNEFEREGYDFDSYSYWPDDSLIGGWNVLPGTANEWLKTVKSVIG